MKTKKFHKKMVLNKKTIVHLGNGELKVVDGGNEYCKTGMLPTCITFYIPATGEPCVYCHVDT
jgi:hypothetical protein